MRARKLTAALAAVPLLLAGAVGTAMADDISNDLDTTVDAVAEVMSLNVGGANGTTQLYITPANGDGKNGCNLTGSTTLGLAVTSSNTAVATVSPSSVTFTSCGDAKSLTVTPLSTGTATISVGQTSNNTGATFDLAPATFAVNVAAAAPSNTAPAIAIEGVTGGADYAKGSVPRATCRVTDAEDGNSSFPATLSAVTGAYASDGIGSQTASCSYTDAGGLTASASETYSIVDGTAPVVSYDLDPASPDGNDGWYKSDVALTWTVTESESPHSLDKVGCLDQQITGDQAATTYTCSAKSAGGSASEEKVTIKRDATAPGVALKGISPQANSAGWYNVDVTATFEATDNLSGVSGSDTADVTVSDEGADVEIQSPAFSDVAGNTTAAGATGTTVNIDKTGPTQLALIGGPAAGSTNFWGDVPAAPTCTANDSLSGLASCVVTGYSDKTGTHTLTATATDNAGNESIATRTYTVKAWDLKGFYSPVDLGGVVNTVKAGSTVPLKFEAFAAQELTSVSVVKSFMQKEISCSNSAPIDEIELVTTGGTSLRYDTTGGQFIQNWQTPKKPAACYVATVTLQDGSSISANFKLK